MRPLASLTLRWVSIAVTTVALLAIAAGMVRLLPWLLAPEVPLKVSMPFARTLLSVAIEAAFIMGTPIGAGIAAAVFVERGEARALQALGMRPAVLVLRAVPAFAGASALTLLALVAMDVDATRPGRIARALVSEGRESCERAEQPRTVGVPMVGLTWLCSPDHPPRAAGTMPGTAGRLWFSASSFDLSEDLREVELGALTVALRASGELPPARIHVRHARVRGLAPWGHPAKLGATHRAVVIVASAWLMGLAMAFWVIASRIASRTGAVVLGSLSGLTALALLHGIDKGAWSGEAYLLVPLASASVAPLLVGLITLARASVPGYRLAKLRDFLAWTSE